MDASPLFDPQYFPIIAATLIGFGLLAALLLVPIYRFLDREQEVAKHWTPEELEKRIQKAKAEAESDAPDAPRDEADRPKTTDDAERRPSAPKESAQNEST